MFQFTNDTKYYLCLDFKFRLLFRAAAAALWKKCKITVYYAFESRSSNYFNKNRQLIMSVFPKGISITKLPFDVSKMKVEDGRSVIEACYFDSLYKIVGVAEDRCLNGPHSLCKYLSSKLSANKEEIKFWAKHYFSFSIIDQILLVNIALWLKTQESSPLVGADIGVIIDRKNYGFSFVADYVKKKKLSLMAIKTGRKLNENLLFLFCYNLLNLVLSCFMPFNGGKSNDKDSDGKICTYHYGDCSFSDFQQKRNYSLFWYPGSGITPDDILIFSQKSSEIDISEILEAKKNGFNLVACDGLKRNASRLIGRHRCSINSLKYFIEYFFCGLNLVRKVKTSYDYDMAKIIFLLFLHLPYWEDFFKQNNVKVLVKPGALFSWIDVAAKVSGSALISFQNSNIVQTAMGHLECCDTFFVWGKEYSNVYKKPHSLINNLVQSGYIFDHIFSRLNNGALSLRERFENKEISFILSLFDENIVRNVFIISNNVQDAIIKLYEHIFQYAINHKDIGLVVKPKLNANVSVLRASPKISGLIDFLEKEGRVIFLDSSKFPAEAGIGSYLAVGMVSNSTAALECSFAGVPSVYFNSEGSGLFRGNSKGGLERVVFDESEALIGAIEQFRLRQDQSLFNVFSGRASYLHNKDPFRDGKANQRIGSYIKSVFTDMNEGLGKDDAINKANKAYSSLYGEDKIASFSDKSIYSPKLEEHGSTEDLMKDVVNLC